LILQEKIKFTSDDFNDNLYKIEDVEKSYADVLDLTSLKVQQVIETMNSLKES
jgi:hypothetical protein